MQQPNVPLTTKILYFAFMFSRIVFFGIGEFFLKTEEIIPTTNMVYIISGVAAFTALLSQVFFQKVNGDPPKINDSVAISPTQQIGQWFMTFHLLCWNFSEMTAICSLVLLFMKFDPNYFYAFLGLSFLLGALHYPRLGRLEQLLKRVKKSE